MYPLSRARGPRMSLPISQSALSALCCPCHCRNIEPKTSETLSFNAPASFS
ncbi:Uncharacterised protein [Mycobacteroides abscessus subsp. abscessus]|nr:Uncharacterised protein [Mycobacteroides abscessus subsp. abscessus]